MFEAFVNLQEIVLTILAVIVIIIGVGVVYALISAIFKLVFAGGDSDKAKAATNSFRYVIIGVLLSLGFLLITPVAAKKLNLPGHENLTTSAIFDRAGDLLKMLFQFGGEVEWSPEGGFEAVGGDDSYDDTVYTL